MPSSPRKFKAGDIVRILPSVAKNGRANEDMARSVGKIYIVKSNRFGLGVELKGSGEDYGSGRVDHFWLWDDFDLALVNRRIYLKLRQKESERG